MKKRKNMLISLSFLLVLLGGLCLTHFFFPYYKVEKRSKEVIAKQKEGQERVIGWIRVQGTNIDYPIMDATAIETNDITYDYTWMRYHTTKVEHRMAIFGHNIQNVSSKPLMNEKTHRRFEQLMGFLYTNFSKENQYIQLTINGKDYLYRIYAVYLTDEEDLGNNLLKSQKEEYIKKAQAKSYFDFEIPVTKDDPLITLITCTRFFGFSTNNQFKVEGRMVRPLEKVGKQKIKETKNYEKIKTRWEEGDQNEKI